MESVGERERNVVNNTSANGKFPTPLILRNQVARIYIERERMAKVEQKENAERRMSNCSVDKFLTLNKMAKPIVYTRSSLFRVLHGDDARRRSSTMVPRLHR